MAVEPTGGGGAGVASAPAPALPTTGPVTPAEIYLLLLQAGYSTVQAIGIMANAIAESSLNPEEFNPHDPTSSCPGAQSIGLLQWNTCSYPNAPALRTGNPQADIRAQISFLGSSVSQQALQGSTGAQVAGNFAQFFERCAECTPGASSYNARVGNAATVLGWVTSGNWPTAAGGAAGGGGSTGGQAGASACLVQFPGVAGIGATCLLSASQARALIGGVLIAGALPVGLVGMVILAAFAFRNTGAGQAVGRAAETVGGAVSLIPGGQAAGVTVASAGAIERSRSAQGQGRQQYGRGPGSRGGRNPTPEARARREQDAQDRHTASQYRKQPGARARAQRDAERHDEPVPF